MTFLYYNCCIFVTDKNKTTISNSFSFRYIPPVSALRKSLPTDDLSSDFMTVPLFPVGRFMHFNKS
ncbi:hypothetical protein EDD80_107116 [Anseongella ginsenosidimutans]|uniref:Uncharacterized protein n=1 Tax=Anseongella ginsenosidimutans TaxID=496056 RepID=A0A4R3KR72_9SPHI|nr:hypothetical protein EDD80_107116 [Anseongella ginsenosidimutans]